MLSAIHLFPRRETRAFDGTPANAPLCPVFASVPIEEALNAPFPNDAYAVVYAIEGVPAIPRLRKSAKGWVDQQGGRLVANYLFLDFDNENHAAWAPGGLENVLSRLKALPEWDTCGFYQTAHGFRLVWGLQGLPVEYFRSLSEGMIDRIRECTGLEADPVSRFWTGLYRIPHATPPGADRPLNLYKDLDRLGFLTWAPDTLEAEETVEEAYIDVYPSPPEGLAHPAREEFDCLRGSEWYSKLVAGKPIGIPGGRRTAILKCAGFVAKAAAAKDPVTIYRLMAKSVANDHSVMQRPNGKVDSAPSLMELWQLCCFVASRNKAKVERDERIRDSVFRQIREKQVTTAKQLQQQIVEEDKEGQIVPSENAPEAVPESMEQIQQRIIVGVGKGAYYLLDESTGSYRPPVDSDWLIKGLMEYAPTLIGGGLFTKTGLRSQREILSQYGTFANRTICVMGRKDITFDSRKKLLYEGVCALRTDITPRYHKDIEAWLTLFGGTHHDKLFDWLATLPRLDRPTCALYIKAAPSVGKALFTEGICRLWGAGPTPYANFIANFNDGLTRCPIVWADEAVPALMHGATPSAVFRSLVGNSSFDLRRKFLPTTTIEGCLRLVITANNTSALRIQENLSPEDYAAIVRRIGYLECDLRAAAYLEQHGGRSFTESWVAEDKIAEHVLWLAENRQVTSGSRFIVEGWETPFHRRMNLGFGINGNVLEILAYIIQKQKTVEGIYVGEGRVFVNVAALQGVWQVVLGQDARTPTKFLIRESLRNYAVGQRSYRVRTKSSPGRAESGEQIRCWEVSAEEILYCAETLQIGDPDTMREVLQREAAFTVSDALDETE